MPLFSSTSPPSQPEMKRGRVNLSNGFDMANVSKTSVWYVSWAIRRYSFLVKMRKRCRRRFRTAKVSDLPSPERYHISSSGLVEATDIALARIPRYCRSQRRSWCHHPGSSDLGRLAGQYRDRYPHGSFCKLQQRAIPQVRSWIRKLARG